MGKIKKLIELDNKTLAIFEKEAKLQKRSLKNYIEFTLHETALNLTEPSEEYKAIMDDMLEKQENGEIKWVSSKEVRERYGR